MTFNSSYNFIESLSEVKDFGKIKIDDKFGKFIYPKRYTIFDTPYKYIRLYMREKKYNNCTHEYACATLIKANKKIDHFNSKPKEERLLDFEKDIIMNVIYKLF